MPLRPVPPKVAILNYGVPSIAEASLRAYDGAMPGTRALNRRLATGLTLAVLLQTGCLFKVTWLPDGQHLAYWKSESVWLINLKGQKKKIYTVPELNNMVSLIAAPVQNRLALLGEVSGTSFMTILNDTGEVLWSSSLTGRNYDLLPLYWRPDGESVFAAKEDEGLMLVDLDTGTMRWIETGGHIARFSSTGTILSFHRMESGKASLEVFDQQGNLKKSYPWIIPDEIAEPDAQMLSEDGRRLWIEDGAAKGKTYLINRKGKVLHVGDHEIHGLGSNDWSMVTRNGGFKLINARQHTSVNLTPFYNRMLHHELTAHLADPAHANARFKSDDVVFFPVFSPDGKLFALYGNHGLYIADLKTGEVRALTQW